MSERRRAVELARHIREVEGRSIAQVAERLGRSPARVKAYFYDPTGEKARAVRGDTSACAAAARPTPSRATAKATLTVTASAAIPGAIRPRWTEKWCSSGRRETAGSYLPMTGPRTHAKRRGGTAARRLSEGEWPTASFVSALVRSWERAGEAAQTGVGIRPPLGAYLPSSVVSFRAALNRRARAGKSRPRHLWHIDEHVLALGDAGTTSTCSSSRWPAGGGLGRSIDHR